MSARRASRAVAGSRIARARWRPTYRSRTWGSEGSAANARATRSVAATASPRSTAARACPRRSSATESRGGRAGPPLGVPPDPPDDPPDRGREPPVRGLVVPAEDPEGLHVEGAHVGRGPDPV